MHACLRTWDGVHIRTQAREKSISCFGFGGQCFQPNLDNRSGLGSNCTSNVDALMVVTSQQVPWPVTVELHLVLNDDSPKNIIPIIILPPELSARRLRLVLYSGVLCWIVYVPCSVLVIMTFSGLFGAFGFNLDNQILRTEFPPGTLFFLSLSAYLLQFRCLIDSENLTGLSGFSGSCKDPLCTEWQTLLFAFPRDTHVSRRFSRASAIKRPRDHNGAPTYFVWRDSTIHRHTN